MKPKFAQLWLKLTDPMLELGAPKLVGNYLSLYFTASRDRNQIPGRSYRQHGSSVPGQQRALKYHAFRWVQG